MSPIHLPKSEIWPRFSTSVASDLVWSQNKEIYPKSRTFLGSADDWPMYPTKSGIVLFSQLRGVGATTLHSEKRAGNFVKSTVLQQFVVRSCWNLTDWRTICPRRQSHD